MWKVSRQRCICQLLFQPAEGLFRCSQMVLSRIPLQLSEIFAALNILLSCPLYSESLSAFWRFPLFSRVHHNILFLYMLSNKKPFQHSHPQIIKLRTVIRNVCVAEQRKWQWENVAAPHIPCVLDTILPRHILADPMFLKHWIFWGCYFYCYACRRGRCRDGAATNAQVPLQGLWRSLHVKHSKFCLVVVPFTPLSFTTFWW